MRPNSLSDVKQANRHLLYECIRERQKVTMTELEHTTKLSRPTIAGLVQDMMAEGTVVKVGLGPSRGGRAPTLYGINARAAFAMGVDFEFPAVRVTISDLYGEVVLSSIRRYPSDSCRDEAISLLLTQMEDLLAESGVDAEKLLGIGMGVPGVIDYKNNYSVIFERIPGWEDVPIGEIVEKRFGRPVSICNDVNLLAWAEWQLNPEDDITDMLYVVIRSGIGMAICMDGQLVQGEGGNAGRIGHLLVNPQGPPCRCGSRGCLGLYTGIIGMCNRYHELTGQRVSHATELIERACDGDGAAARTLETAGHYLGVGIVNIANLFDISNVVVSAVFDTAPLLEAAQQPLDICNRYTLKRKINVSTGNLHESQYALGGCLLVLDQFRTGQKTFLTPRT